jgi:hypothetical protein
MWRMRRRKEEEGGGRSRRSSWKTGYFNDNSYTLHQ